ncbi:MAG: hypothetical protein AAFY71_24225 [Bacteroidota bacterium]
MRTILSTFTWALIFLLIVGNTQAQEVSKLKEDIYKAYVSGEGGKWSNLLSQMEGLVNAESSRDDILDLAEAQYGYIGLLLTDKRKKEATTYINKAEKWAKILLERNPKDGRSTALYGSLLAMEIDVSPGKTLTLGPKALSLIEKGIKLSPNEPSVWVQMANVKHHAPSFFGGNKKEAVEMFTKGIKLFDQQFLIKKNNWQYLHALVWLAKSYEELGNEEMAIKTYKIVLAYQSDFAWVKNTLLPELVANNR